VDGFNSVCRTYELILDQKIGHSDIEDNFDRIKDHEIHRLLIDFKRAKVFFPEIFTKLYRGTIFRLSTTKISYYFDREVFVTFSTKFNSFKSSFIKLVKEKLCLTDERCFVLQHSRTKGRLVNLENRLCRLAEHEESKLDRYLNPSMCQRVHDEAVHIAMYEIECFVKAVHSCLHPVLSRSTAFLILITCLSECTEPAATCKSQEFLATCLKGISAIIAIKIRENSKRSSVCYCKAWFMDFQDWLTTGGASCLRCVFEEIPSIKNEYENILKSFLQSKVGNWVIHAWPNSEAYKFYYNLKLSHIPSVVKYHHRWTSSVMKVDSTNFCPTTESSQDLWSVAAYPGSYYHSSGDCKQDEETATEPQKAFPIPSVAAVDLIDSGLTAESLRDFESGATVADSSCSSSNDGDCKQNVEEDVDDKNLRNEVENFVSYSTLLESFRSCVINSMSTFDIRSKENSNLRAGGTRWSVRFELKSQLTTMFDLSTLFTFSTELYRNLKEKQINDQIENFVAFLKNTSSSDSFHFFHKYDRFCREFYMRNLTFDEGKLERKLIESLVQTSHRLVRIMPPHHELGNLLLLDILQLYSFCRDLHRTQLELKGHNSCLHKPRKMSLSETEITSDHFEKSDNDKDSVNNPSEFSVQKQKLVSKEYESSGQFNITDNDKASEVSSGRQVLNVDGKTFSVVCNLLEALNKPDWVTEVGNHWSFDSTVKSYFKTTRFWLMGLSLAQGPWIWDPGGFRHFRL